MRIRPFQRAVQAARRVVPRGWSPAIALLARYVPRLQHYPVQLRDGTQLVLDLRTPISHGYFLDGGSNGDGIPRLLEAILSPGSVYVDVGAHVGHYVTYASHLVRDAGTVYGFEPHPVAYAALVANSRPNTQAIPAAVGAAEGEARFALRAHEAMSGFADAGDANTITVPVVTLDRALAHLPRLDLLKIDVEGYELDVLRGARGIIERLRPLICFEHLWNYAAQHGTRINDYRAVLHPLGYRLHWLDSTCETDQLIRAKYSSDILAVPNEHALTGPLVEHE